MREPIRNNYRYGMGGSDEGYMYQFQGLAEQHDHLVLALAGDMPACGQLAYGQTESPGTEPGLEASGG